MSGDTIVTGLTALQADGLACVACGVQGRLRTPEEALRFFNLGSHIRARLVWFNPDAATPPEDDDEAA